MSEESQITVAILAGGFGTRLRSINKGKQKVILDVDGYPFLRYLLEKLNLFGFKDVVLCTGYLGNQIKEKFKEKYKNLKIMYSQEDSPLGTAGALRLALPYLKSEAILIMNGDSYCEADLMNFSNFHFKKSADVSLIVKKLPNTDRFGRVNLNTEDRVISFEEKNEGSGEGYINAGIYIINKSLIATINENTEVSLEKEMFPKWIGKKIYGFKTEKRFIDIGTVESYAKAEDFFKEKVTKRFILLDRDGTLLIHRPYLSHPNQVELIPGAVEALKEFKNMGLGIVIITNQSGVGRGYFDLDTLDKIHQRLAELLSKEGVFLDDIYFCPHTPEDDCLCRKPKAQLVEQAAKKHHFEPKLCFVIGDNKADIELGRNIGATTILVRTGYGKQVEKELSADYVVDDLNDALLIIRNAL